MLFGQRVIPGLCAAQQTARNEHRVAGGGQQHGVALIAQHHADVAHALLTAGAAGYLIRRDLYAEAALVVAAHSIQQLRQVAQAVLPVLRVGGCVHHGLADVLGRRKVRCADAQIINSTALSFQFHLAFVQCGEDLIAEQIQSFGKLHILIPLFNTDHFDNRAILARFACLRNEKGRWGRKFQLSVMGSEGCFTGETPSVKSFGFASSLNEGASGEEEKLAVLPKAPSPRGLAPKVTGGVSANQSSFLSAPRR